jgi:hypothetical protein
LARRHPRRSRAGEPFKSLSEQRVGYDKIAYSVSLTDWLIEHAPEDLRELAELMADMIKRSR